MDPLLIESWLATTTARTSAFTLRNAANFFDA
jgi:hypothetical protein